MAQKLKQTTKKTPVAAKRAAGKAAPAAGGKPASKSASVAPDAKPRAGVARSAVAFKTPAGKLLAGKAVTTRPLPGKPAAGKAPLGKHAGAGEGRPALAAVAARGKLPSVAERARQATAAARAAAAKGGPKDSPDNQPRPRIKSPYSRKSLGPLKQKLHDLRARLAGDIDSMGKEALRADEPEVDAENVADYSSDAFERTITLELMENEARTLRQINDALEAMAAGVFGVCVACGEAIPLARLEALPFASNCVKCQAAAERLL